MKLKINSIVFILLTQQVLFSQSPGIEWQQTIGGNSFDNIVQIEETPDGGYMVGGFSSSGVSGDKTEASFAGGTIGYDYWILKLDENGNIIWQNTLNANRDDVLADLVLCSDGGYLLAGYSSSGTSGDKSENVIGGGITNPDYWIVKLNSVGVMEWENSIGGDQGDYLKTAKQTADGGFILGGSSLSGISGDKTELCFGSSDYWMVKINSTGFIEWQKTIGGVLYDDFSSLDIALDGGYILGGSSVSPISGNKSENCIGNSDIYPDYWIVKTDASGNIEWDHTSGGKRSDYLSALQSCADGGYIVGGKSDSRSFGDKSEDNMTGPLKYDYWVFKMDEDGNVIWDNSIGGSDGDHLNALDQTSDNGFYFAGYSNSTNSFDKSEPLSGFSDYWIIKTDANGNIIWENSIIGLGSDFLYVCNQTSDGGIILGGNSSSGIGADKTEGVVGETADFWIIKIAPETCPLVTGIFTDNITTTKATANWNIIPGADSYQIWYRPIGAGTWTKKLATTNFKTIKSIIPDTDYEYQVRAECSDGEFGAFTDLQNFTTLPLRAELDLVSMEMDIFPNPNTGFFTISAEISSQIQNNEIVQIQIFDLTGKLIHNQQNKFNNGIINEDIHLKNIPSGIYILKCFSENITIEEKIIIE